MANPAAVLRILVTANGAQAIGSLKAVEAQAGKTSAAGGRMGKAFATFAKVGFAAAVGGAVAAGKEFKNFQQAMTQVETQAGASHKEVVSLTGAVKELAKRSQFSPTDLAKGLYRVESAGFRGAHAMRVLNASQKLAAIGNSDLELTTKAVTATMNTNIKGAKGLSQTIGTLNAAVGQGDMRMNDLIGALSTGILPAAKSAGLGLRDVTGAIDIMTRRGVPAEAAATRLRMTFSLLGAPTKQAAKALGGIGLSSSQLADDMRKPNGLVTALSDLKQHLKDSGDNATQANMVIARAFGGGRSSSAIQTLLQNVGELSKVEQDTTKHANDVDAAYKRQSQTVNAKLKTAWSSIQVLLINVGAKIAPAAATALKRVADIITDPKLSSDEKFSKVADMASQAFEKAAPKIADAAGRIAPKAAGAFVRAFITAGPWTQLVVGGWLVSKLVGWRAIFRAAGMAAGAEAAAGAGAGMATGGVGGAVGKALFGRGLIGAAKVAAGRLVLPVGIAIGAIEVTRIAEENARKKFHQIETGQAPATPSYRARTTPAARRIATATESPQLAPNIASAMRSGNFEYLRKIRAELRASLADYEAYGKSGSDAAKRQRAALATLSDFMDRNSAALDRQSAAVNRHKRAVDQFGHAVVTDTGMLKDNSAALHRGADQLDQFGPKAFSTAGKVHGLASSLRDAGDKGEGARVQVHRLGGALDNLDGKRARVNIDVSAKLVEVNTAAYKRTGSSGNPMNPTGRQMGGMVVPGFGSGDKVPLSAMVEPGEQLFVLNRNASGMLDFLTSMNAAVPRFAAGGNLSLAHPGSQIRGAAGRMAGRAEGKWLQRHLGRFAPKVSVSGGRAAGSRQMRAWAAAGLKAAGVPATGGNISTIVGRMIQESGGNPSIVNTWDSNAAAGTPSTGLMQTIWPTFKAYHVRGTSWSMTDPIANVAAAVRYMLARYGHLVGSGPGGYQLGGIVGEGTMRKLWGAARNFYPGAGGHGMPRTVNIPGLPFVGDLRNLDVRNRPTRAGQEVNWPSWMGNWLLGKGGASKQSAAVETLIHEWAHYFQSNKTFRMGDWATEGGAQAFTRQFGPAIAAAAGLPFMQQSPADDTYMGFVRKVRGRLGAKWIRTGQFGGYQRGGLMASAARKKAKPPKPPAQSMHWNPFTNKYEFMTSTQFKALQARWIRQHPNERMPSGPAHPQAKSRHWNPFQQAYQMMTSKAFKALQTRWTKLHPKLRMPSGPTAPTKKPGASSQYQRVADLISDIDLGEQAGILTHAQAVAQEMGVYSYALAHPKKLHLSGRDVAQLMADQRSLSAPAGGATMQDAALALAQLTPGTADDIAALQALQTTDQGNLAAAIASGDPQAIVDAASALKGINDQLGAFNDNTQALADALKAVQDEMKRNNDINEGTLAITAREATRAMTDVLAGQLGYRVNTAGFSPGFGVGARY